MPSLKTTLAFPALMLLSTAAMAQEAASFEELSAERTGADEVMLHAVFQGGACQETQPAETEPGEEEGTLSVTIPTVSTSEVCTMQLVEIEVEETIEAGEDITTLAVTVLGPQGEIEAEGSADIGEGDGENDAARGMSSGDAGDANSAGSSKDKSDSAY